MNTNENYKGTDFKMSRGYSYKHQEKKRNLEDSSLKRFARKNETLNSFYKMESRIYFLLLFLFFGIMLFASIVGIFNGSMEVYTVLPTAILSSLGLLILLKDIKKLK